MAKVTIIEGTADEIIGIAKGLDKAEVITTDMPPSTPQAANLRKIEKVFVSFDVALRVLGRRPLSDEQKLVVSILAKAHPGWVPAGELQAKIGYTPAQFAGLMGAFGRRFSHTDGWVEGSWLFDAEWNHDKKAYDYRLPDTVLEAAKHEKLI